MYSCGPLHMNEQRQDDQLEPTYNSSVPIQDVVLKNYQERWTIEKGGKRKSGRPTLAVWHDNDDDSMYICIGGVAMVVKLRNIKLLLILFPTINSSSLLCCPSLHIHFTLTFTQRGRSFPNSKLLLSYVHGTWCQ